MSARPRGARHRIALVTLLLLLLTMPAAAGAAGTAPAPHATAPIAGLREWNEHRAESRRLIAELKADPARAKAAQRFEQEWLALDRAVQKAGTLQARGRLDAKAARTTADALEAQMRRLQGAAEALDSPRTGPPAKLKTAPEAQTVSALMQALTTVIKAIGDGLKTAARQG